MKDIKNILDLLATYNNICPENPINSTIMNTKETKSLLDFYESNVFQRFNHGLNQEIRNVKTEEFSIDVRLTDPNPNISLLEKIKDLLTSTIINGLDLNVEVWNDLDVTDLSRYNYILFLNEKLQRNFNHPIIIEHYESYKDDKNDRIILRFLIKVDKKILDCQDHYSEFVNDMIKDFLND